MNISRHNAPLRARATSDIRRSPNGSWRLNSSMRRRELPPLSDIVTTAVMLNGYFFKWERMENVPEPPPIVTMRLPAKRSPVRLFPCTVYLLRLISGSASTIRSSLLLIYTNLLYVIKGREREGEKGIR